MSRFLKLKIEIPLEPAIPLLGIILKEFTSSCFSDACIVVFTAAHHSSWLHAGNNLYVHQQTNGFIRKCSICTKWSATVSKDKVKSFVGK